MTDLAERLRAQIRPHMFDKRIAAGLMREAANEIERLLRLCQDLADVQRQNEETYGKAAAKIERLHAEGACTFREAADRIKQQGEEIERLRAALKLITTGEPAAAGSAKPLSFKEWARMVAATALTGALR